MIVSNRFCIKSIFIAKKSNINVYDVGILTTEFAYHELSFEIEAKSLTYSILDKLYNKFKSFKFETTTDAMLSDTITLYDPFYVWIKALSNEIGFSLMTIGIDRIPKRILAYHRTYLNKKSSEVDISYINKLWTKIIKNDRCPWITQSIEDDMKLKMSNSRYKRSLFIKMAVYYMLIKKSLYAKFQLSK